MKAKMKNEKNHEIIDRNRRELNFDWCMKNLDWFMFQNLDASKDFLEPAEN